MFRWIALSLKLFLPAWRQMAKPDSHHAYGRTLTKGYIARKSIVKNMWIGSALLMLAMPALPVVIGLGLFTTFVSFMFLDEAKTN